MENIYELLAKQLQVFFSSRMTAVQLKNSREFSWSGSRLITSLIYYFKSPPPSYFIIQNFNRAISSYKRQFVKQKESSFFVAMVTSKQKLTAAHLFIALIKSMMRTPSITKTTCSSFMALSNVDENSNHHNFSITYKFMIRIQRCERFFFTHGKVITTCTCMGTTLW